MTVVDERIELVRQLRRLADAVVGTELSPIDARRTARAVSALVDELPVTREERPWYWYLPLEERDGSAGWKLHNPVAPPLELVAHEDHMTGRIRFGRAFTGPPGRVHGGYLAAVLDHALGIHLSAIGRPSLTLSLTVTYPAPTPLGEELEVAVWCTDIDGRRTTACAEVRHQGVATARAEGHFLTPRPVQPHLTISHTEDRSPAR